MPIEYQPWDQVIINGDYISSDSAKEPFWVVVILSVMYIQLNQINMIFLRIVDPIYYMLLNDQWIWLTAVLRMKVDGRRRRKNKQDLIEIINKLRSHPFYRLYSIYDIMLPRVISNIWSAKNIQEFNQAQRMLVIITSGNLDRLWLSLQLGMILINQPIIIACIVVIIVCIARIVLVFEKKRLSQYLDH